jgi:hypothetical protein
MLRLVLVITLAATASMAFANATIPTADKKGSKDSPLLQRVQAGANPRSKGWA